MVTISKKRMNEGPVKLLSVKDVSVMVVIQHKVSENVAEKQLIRVVFHWSVTTQN